MITEYFLENLNRLMEKGGLKQVELSRILYKPPGAVNNWFRKKSIPADETVEQLAKYFNVEPYYFFMKPGTQGQEKPTERDDSFKVLMDDLAEKYLSEDDRKAYHHFGGANLFVKLLRINYETSETRVTDWYQKLAEQLGKYATIDLIEKIRSKSREKEAAKKSESA